MEEKIRQTKVSAYRVPTLTPESDGTLDWDHTVIVITEITAGEKTGIGFTYSDISSAVIINNILSGKIKGMNAFDISSVWEKMVVEIRNLGRDGIVSTAISAVDTALWDLKAKLLGFPLVSVLGKMKDKVALYGSGGFTNYTEYQMRKQTDLWRSFGINKVKIKIGRNPKQDISRVQKLKKYAGDKLEIFVDANGAFTKKEALYYGKSFADLGVTWFEEPVSSDELDSLRFLTSTMPAPVNIAAGEYGYNLFYFRRMLEQKAVDILQVDATRCGGFSEMIKAINLASAFCVPVSTHCAPYLHLHSACATEVIHMEYFFDHFRIEREFFEGANDPIEGNLFPDLSKPGIGLELKKKDAEKYLIP